MTSHLHTRVARLSTEDKVRLLTGRTGWVLHGSSGAGLLPVTFSDGPAGVRGTEATQEEHSASIPNPTAVAAAWDTALMERTGRFFAAEARRKDVDVVLAPVLNLHRSPAGGRHFECLSEDPFLTGELGAAFVRAIQAEGVGACPKHFIGNETEHERTSYRARIDERTLREVYLPPFEAALGAGAWTIMAAYNGVDDGTESNSMTDHRRLLAGLLKEEFGFDGVVISDWTATRSAAPSANAGLDLVMPGPRGPWAEGDALLAAVRSGEVGESVVDDKVVRLLRLAERVGKLDQDTSRAVEAEDERTVLREIGSRGHVLLRNEGALLPVATDGVRRVALIGPNAVDAYTQGGGSAHVNATYLISPAEGLREALPKDVELTVVRGGDPRRLLPVAARDLVTRLGMTLFDASGEPLGTPGLDRTAFHVHVDDPLAVSAVVTADLTLTEPGTHRLEVGVVGRHTVRIDGALLSEGGRTATDAEILESRHSHPDGPRTEVEVAESAPRTVRVEVVSEVADFGGFGRGVIAQLRHLPPGPSTEEEILEAVRAAEEADVAIVVVGTNDEVESEGYDRPTLSLPGRQDELVRRVSAANPRTVVVVNAGAPVLLPWLDEVPAVLWSWFGGHEYGHALADTLTGRAEPTGRLPWTLPRDHDDVPVMDTRPVNGVLAYDEGVFVGHRAYDRDGVEPHRPFGFGLGYTDWEIGGAELSATEAGRDGGLIAAPLTATATLTNTGDRPGRHVVQVYVEPPADSAGTTRPVRALAAFASVYAAPGTQSTVHLDIPPRALAVWDTATRSWRTPEGTYHLSVASSSRAIAHRLPFDVR